MLLFYDKETSGLPDFGQPSEAPHQPHIVQMAAALVDPGSRRVVASIDLIIEPDGWEIPADVAAIHGIDTALAKRLGVPEDSAVAMFMRLYNKATKRIAHNESFDARIMRIALKRFGYPEIAVDRFKEFPAECTMAMSKPICKLPPTGKMTRAGFNNYKNPKLTEAYEHIIGKPMDGAHNAMADVQGCMAIYWAMKDVESQAAVNA